MPKAVHYRNTAGAVLSAWLTRWRHSEHARGVLLIGLFKLSKAVLSIALGVGALRLLHRDLGDVVLRVTNALPIDPESHFVALLMDKADLIGAHQLKEFSAVTFSYAIVCLVEGTGLVLEKPWAEWFTISLTLLGLPWEVFELFRHPTNVRVAVLLINLVVLFYLLWLLRRKPRRERTSEARS